MYQHPYNQYRIDPKQTDPFTDGFKGCMGVGCAIVAVAALGFLAMGAFIIVAVLES